MKPVRAGRRRQRAATIVEFSVCAPLFFIFLMLLMDFGKFIYVKNTLDAAAREGARRAILLNNPATSDVLAAVQSHSSDVALPNNPCAYSGSQTAPTGGNSGYMYMTAPPAGGNGTYVPGGGCTTPTAASNHQTITVTIVYSYKPLTLFISSIVGNITITTTSTMATEY